MPAHRRVNQREKRDRLPSNEALHRAGDGIVSWWECAYLVSGDLVLPSRFGEDARASLSGLSARTAPRGMTRSWPTSPTEWSGRNVSAALWLTGVVTWLARDNQAASACSA